MGAISKTPVALAAFAMIAAPAWSAASAQDQDWTANESRINVYGSVPTDLSGLEAGPEIDGFISARRGSEMQVTSADGAATDILVGEITEIKAKGGFLGLERTSLGTDSLLNGLPVTVETVQWEGGLVASKIRFKDDDLETAAMIRGATNQRFVENETAIEENAVATEALRGRMASIDQYNIKGTTNVYFDTGKAALSPQARAELCQAAQQAQAMDNALLLVVGYTDSTGSQEVNQALSERRAGSVVNHLQQQCGWEPWRMLSPTGMAEADPAADNTTAYGKAQNRRVAVNILVSKAVEEENQYGG